VNWEQIRKHVGNRNRLEPPAVHLDAQGNDLPELEHDDWIVQTVTGDVLTLQNVHFHQVVQLAKDNIKEFGFDAVRSVSGTKHGFLILKVQVFTQGTKLWVRGTPRPGEPVARQRRIANQWTPWRQVVSSGFPPQVTQRATLQYKLWCDDPVIPLMIRFASTPDGGYQQEVSGPSGVVDQLILESETYYISLSHPKVRYEIAVTAFQIQR
jgi:hypothetical protein